MSLFRIRPLTPPAPRRRAASRPRPLRTRLVLEAIEARLCPSALTLNYVDSGFWDSTGAHDASTKGYFAGQSGGREDRNYFVFNLAGVQKQIAGAELRLNNPATGYVGTDATKTYSLYDVSTPLPRLRASGTGQTDIFDDLGSGTSYGAQTVSAADNGHLVTIPLNDDGLAYLNANRGQQIALGGAASPLSGGADQGIFRGSGSSGDTRQLVLALRAAGPNILSTTPAGDTFNAITGVRVTFDEPVQANTFTPDQVVFIGPSGPPIPVTAVTSVDGSGDRQFDVAFPRQTDLGPYSMVIGPNILGLDGSPMDQNENGVAGEVPGDQYVARFTLQGPKIIANTAPPDRFGPVNSLRVTFNEPMAPTTFTPAQVRFTGPHGTINPTITPVGGTNNTQFNIAFPDQTATGVYTMVIGPNIKDPAGHAMDQNGNFIPGETPGDQYTVTFRLLGPKILSTLSGTFQPGLTGVTVFFNEPMNPSTFRPAAVIFTGPQGPIPVLDVTVAKGSNNTVFSVRFSPLTVTSSAYRMIIGPNIQDMFGNLMDQNNNFITGEIPGDQFIGTFSIQGPRIISGPPSSFTPGVSSVRVIWSEAMDPTTFTPDTVVFTGPSGDAIPVTRVVPVSGTNNTQFDIQFNPVADIGRNYRMVIGPYVADTYGNWMDQNMNFVTGEIPGDQYVATFNVVGLRVNSSTPTGNLLGQVSAVRVFFNAPVDPTRFTPAQVARFTGPNGDIPVSGVYPVGGTNTTTFDITFAPQFATGRYTMVIGPDVEDLYGNQMDQNGNFIAGEVPGDQYTATFGIQGPKVNSSTPTGTANLPGTIDHVRMTFNETIDRASFTPDQVLSFTGPGGGPIPINDVQPVPGTGGTQFDVSFDPLTVAGSYRMVLAADIRDLYGNAMDQNGNLIPGEVPGDEYVATFGVAGPQVVSLARNGLNPDPATSVRVTFNEPIDPDTFTPDRVTLFTDPSGNPVAVNDVTPVDGSGGRQFDITFDAQTAYGTYTVMLGTGLADLYGNLATTTFRGQFMVTPVYTAAADLFEDLDIHGQPGTFRVLQFGTNTTAAVNLGTHTFNFYGVVYTGTNRLFASSNGLISFGTGDSSSTNTNLTASPSEPVIAPLWSFWTKQSGTDMVEGLIDTANHRLILQWNAIQHYPSSPRGITFQVILTLDTGNNPGDIVFNYVDLDTGDGNANGATATVGIKNSGTQGPDRVLVSFNMPHPLVGGGLAIRLAAPPQGDGNSGNHGRGKRPVTVASTGGLTEVTAEQARALPPVMPPASRPVALTQPVGRESRSVPGGGVIPVVDQVFASVAARGRALRPARWHRADLAPVADGAALFADFALAEDWSR